MFFVKFLAAIYVQFMLFCVIPVIWAGDPSNLKLYFLVDNNNKNQNDASYQELKTTGLIDLIPKVDSPISNQQVMMSLMACNKNNPTLITSNQQVFTINMPTLKSQINLRLDNMNCEQNNIEKGLSELKKIIDPLQDVDKIVVVFLRSNLLPQREEELKIQTQAIRDRGAKLIFVDMRPNTARFGSPRILGSLSFGSSSQPSDTFFREFTWAQRNRVKLIIKCEFESLGAQNNSNSNSCKEF